MSRMLTHCTCGTALRLDREDWDEEARAFLGVLTCPACEAERARTMAGSGPLSPSGLYLDRRRVTERRSCALEEQPALF